MLNIITIIIGILLTLPIIVMFKNGIAESLNLDPKIMKETSGKVALCISIGIYLVVSYLPIVNAIFLLSIVVFTAMKK